MHEESLVRTLLHQVDCVINENNATAAVEVEVEIGALSGVEPALVRSAFERLSTGTRCEASHLRICEVPLTVECVDCQSTSPLQNFVFRCPACGGASVNIVRGDQFRLLTVTVDTTSKVTS